MENSLTHWNFKAVESTSKLKYVQNQYFFKSQCSGSKEVEIAKVDRRTCDIAIDDREERFHRPRDAKIASALKRLLEKELVPKSNVLNNTTDSYEDDRLLT